jgi:solute carrier family 25 oxoglutarate transporter 11
MSDKKAAPVNSTFKAVGNFALGGLSGMVATTCVQPIDMVKVRIQILSGENPGKKFSPFGVA